MKTICIKKPIITEKSLRDAKMGIFTFETVPSATKNDLKNNIEKMYNVHVVKVKTLIKKGKTKMVGKKRTKVKKQNVKKAYFYLKKGEKIDLFEVGETK